MKATLKKLPNLTPTGLPVWAVRYNGRDIGNIWQRVGESEWWAERDHSFMGLFETKQQAIDLLVSERDTDKDKIYKLQKEVKKLRKQLKEMTAEFNTSLLLLDEFCRE